MKYLKIISVFCWILYSSINGICQTQGGNTCATAVGALPVSGQYEFSDSQIMGATSTHSGCSPASYVDEWFYITAGSSGSESFQYTDMNAVFGRQVVYSGTCNNLTQVDCQLWLPNTNVIVSGLTQGQTYYIKVAYPNNGYTGVATESAILPIELTYFNTYIQSSTIRLKWQTASEINNAGFELQKTRDFSTWEKIVWVDGRGNSNGIVDYEYLDNFPFSGLNYYRLKQIDFDGQFEFSDIVAVDFLSEKTAISIYPNPSNDYLTIKPNDEINDSNIEIFDSLGRLIYKIDNVSTDFELNVSKWETGLYFIHYYCNNTQQVERFVKK